MPVAVAQTHIPTNKKVPLHSTNFFAFCSTNTTVTGNRHIWEYLKAKFLISGSGGNFENYISQHVSGYK